MNVKKKMKKTIFYLAEGVLALVFCYAALQLYQIYRDYDRAVDEYARLAEEIVMAENMEYLLEDRKAEEEASTGQKVPPYVVDLEEMKRKNPDTVGWIILPDSKINYPIVQSRDNEEYLTTTFEGTKASSGAIFMDKYCEPAFSGLNTVIYGHNMKNGSMFRALNNMTDPEYFATHHVFCIDTGEGFAYYEVISCYETVETDKESWRMYFEDEEMYAEWLERISNRCGYDCAQYRENQNTITLSTCRGSTGGPGRFIVHLQKMCTE